MHTSRQDNERPEKPRFISRLRALANMVLLVSGILFLISFLVVLGATDALEVDTLYVLTQIVSYLGFIAVVAFITSFISILIENRTGENREQGEENP